MNKTENRIKLKPILNIQPSVYIIFLYSFFILFIFFLIALLPGILRNGTELSVVSSPLGASVTIDNKRVGFTPINLYIEGGTHEIIVSKSNFKTKTDSIDIKANPLFSLFRKTNLQHHVTLETNSGLDILKHSYSDLAEWSLISLDDINKRYQLPNIISSAVIDYYYSTDFDSSILNQYLLSSIKSISNEIILKDYLDALIISKSNNKLPSISTMVNIGLSVSNLMSERENIPLLLYNRVLRDTNITMNNDLYQKMNDIHRKIINKSVTIFEDKKDNIQINNMTFIHIPKSNILPTNVNFIHSIEQDEFYIMKTMVSKELFNLFINENPMWSKLNKTNLIDEGLVDINYLNFFYEEDYITNISLFAAKEWCKWANNYFELPKNMKIILPNENMWFSVKEYNVLDDIEAWQWTSNGFFLYDHFLTDDDGNTIEEFADVMPSLVVGKNKYNNKVEAGRGVQKANWCTPYISFRPVLVKE